MIQLQAVWFWILDAAGVPWQVAVIVAACIVAALVAAWKAS